MDVNKTLLALVAAPLALSALSVLAQPGKSPAVAPSGSTASAASASPTFTPPPLESRPTNEVTADAKAAAETLFLKGQKFHESGLYEQACPLFEESLKLDFGLGTLLFLSDCQEQLGKTASAWGGFREAEALARSKGQTEREKIARDRAAALAPRLATLRVLVAEENKAIGVVIKRNGFSVGEPVWGQSFPVDPGAQKLEATAPGFKTWSQTIEVPLGPSQTEATIPPLEKAPIQDTGLSGGGGVNGDVMRIAGLSVGGAGLVALAIGTGFGIDAIKTYDDALATCENEDPTRCTPEGVSLQRDASRSALISTVSFTVGAAAVAGGVLLYFLAPASEKAPATPTPQVGAWVDSNGAFFTLGGVL